MSSLLHTSRPSHITSHTPLLLISTLITRDNRLLTILGRHELKSAVFKLGPLGNLLMRGRPVPASAAFNIRGQLIGGDRTTVLYSP